ncbi:MAG: tetratricopeptide repeat protein, partial [Planctomycetota bacterium]
MGDKSVRAGARLALGLALCLALLEPRLVAQRSAAASEARARAQQLLEEAIDRSTPPAVVLQRVRDGLEILGQHPDRSLEVRLRMERSRALRMDGSADEAVAEARRAYELSTELEDRSLAPSLIAMAAYRLGSAEYQARSYDAAIEYARIALTHYRRSGMLREQATVLILVGAAARLSKDYVTSLEVSLEARQISKGLDDDLGVARASNSLGLSYWRSGDLDQAQRYFDEALELFRAAKQGRAVSAVLNNLGIVYVELGQGELAVSTLREALEFVQPTGDRRRESSILNMLGIALRQAGELDESLAVLEQSVAIRADQADSRGVLLARVEIAVVLQEKGEFEASIPMLRQGLDDAGGPGAEAIRADLLELLSIALEKTSDPQGALEASRESAEVRLEVATEAQSRESELRERQQQHDAQLREIEHSAETAAMEADRRRVMQRLTAAGLAIVLLFAAWISVLYRTRHSALVSLRRSHEDLHEANAQLAESEERYRMLFQSAVVSSFVIDRESRRIVDWNEPARDLCGFSSEARDRPLQGLQPDWARVALERLFSADQDDEVAVDDCWVDLEGALRWTEVRGASVSFDGRPCFLVSLRDATEDRAQREEQERIDRLESLGLLAGGIAHDFNNVLTAIAGHVSLARDAEDRDRDEYLRIAEEAADRASHLTGQLLAFAKGGVPRRCACEVEPLVREAVTLARSGSALHVDLEISESVRPVFVDPGQFIQVVTNVVRNAVQATEGKGRLVVRATEFHGSVDGAADLKDRDYVRVDFSDDGPGIPEELRSRVFDPYFTTKSGGNGLGLASSFRIAASHEGALTLQSKEGEGATFSLFVPVAGDPVIMHHADSSAPLAESASILVLEDEATVQRVFRGFLERVGHEVEVVADGEEAVRVYRERKGEGKAFDLLIMDLTIIGGMGGRDALAEIRRTDPDARAIVASGYTDDPAMLRYWEAGFVAAIAKPFQAEALAEV